MRTKVMWPAWNFRSTTEAFYTKAKDDEIGFENLSVNLHLND